MRATGPGPLRALVCAFLALIVGGAALLKLPFATPAGDPIGWVDALFTATSATCVTGLVVRDTGGDFTLFGQVVILLLIQLGGLGIMTFSLIIFSLFSGRVSLAHRTVIEQTVVGRVRDEHLWPLVRLVFRFTMASEAVGALCLFLRFLPERGWASAGWAAVFHSVSAFCNAGFGLWPDSLSSYRADLVVNLVVMALIVLGGLGFSTVYDLGKHSREPRRLSLHSKLALTVSGCLILLGAITIWALESPFSFAGMPLGEQVLASFFQSVTARTAGFNTVDLAALGPATLFILVLLMFIGGSPGSCAGGIKTTTLGVLTLAAASRLRGRSRVNAFRRTLSETTVRNTLSIAFSGLVVVLLALFALLAIEGPLRSSARAPGAFLAYLFETTSALGTVGLSTGVTPALTPAARVLVCLLMFLGRLGPLTVATAFAGADPLDDWQYPEEEVMVG